MIPYKVDFENIAWEHPMRGLRFKAMKIEKKQLRLVEYTKKMDHHWCEKGHCGYVLEGQFEIEFTNQKHVFNPGEGIFIPEGTEHRHKGKPLTELVKVIFVEDI